MSQAIRNTAGLRPPWQAGQSGNDHGQHKKYRTLLRTARIASPTMLKLAIDCAKDDMAPWAQRLTAISLVIDRAWGKPKEHITLDGDGIATLRIEFVDPHAGSKGNDISHQHTGSSNGDACRVIEAETFDVLFSDQEDNSE